MESNDDDFDTMFWDDTFEQEMCNEGSSKSEKKAPPKNAAGNTPQKSHKNALLKYFGHTEFRPMQWQIIYSVLEEKRDNCAVMATGYGKSLCYQFPAIYSNGLSVVISPLISLMEDQVQSLEVANIPACLLGTAQSKKAEVVDNLLAGVYRLVYMTPEFASGEYGVDLLPRLHKALNIIVLAIDEAHCVSQWGHDFRPAYRGLGKIRQYLPTVPILAVTATATDDVKQDIIKSLNLRNPQVLCSGFDRPNLYFDVKKKSADPYADISNILTLKRNNLNVANGSVIIYCLTKKNAEAIVDLLKGHGLKCECYHAGITIKNRKRVHEQFLKDEIKIIVATIAFGMGIDKPNVRCVIHYGASSDMEGYYQESGRAGRDGNPSLCILYHSPSDFVTHNFLRESSLGMSSKVKTHKEQLNAVMKQYISSRECRRQYIISYFDKSWQPPQKTLSNCCDNCTRKLSSPNDSIRYEGIDSEGKYDFTDDTEKFLRSVEYFSPKSFGLGMIIAFLKGSKAKKLNPSCFTSQYHGCGSSKNENWWKEIALLLEQENFIAKESVRIGMKSFPVIVLEKKGINWLRDKKNNKHKPVLLPPTSDIVEFLQVKRIKPLYSAASTVQERKGSNNSSSSMVTSFHLDNTEEIKQLNDYEESLYQELDTLRHSLAEIQNIAPHTIASDLCLQQLAGRRPLTINQLTVGKFDGMSLPKIQKFGDHFVIAIKKYVKNEPEPILTINEILRKHPLGVSSLHTALGATHTASIQMFKDGATPEEIANSRKLALSTIIGHLCVGMRTAHDIDLNRIISAPILYKIIKVIQTPPINNVMTKLAPIKNLCPESVSYDDIKVALTYLEIRNHVKNFNMSFVDKFTLNVQDNKIEYKSSTIAPPNSNISVTDFSKYSLPPKESIEVNNKVQSRQNIPIPMNTSTNNICDDEWDGDDFFSENMNQLDEFLNDTVSKSSNNSHDLTLQDNQVMNGSTAATCSVESSIKNYDLNKDSQFKENDKSSSQKSIMNIPEESDSQRNTTIKKKSIIYIDDDTDEDVTVSKPSSKRKLPDWMLSSSSSNSKTKKIAKNSFFD